MSSSHKGMNLFFVKIYAGMIELQMQKNAIWTTPNDVIFLYILQVRCRNVILQIIPCKVVVDVVICRRDTLEYVRQLKDLGIGVIFEKKDTLTAKVP